MKKKTFDDRVVAGGHPVPKFFFHKNGGVADFDHLALLGLRLDKVYYFLILFEFSKVNLRHQTPIFGI